MATGYECLSNGTATFSHTVSSGDNRLLVVGVSTRGGPISGVTFNGDALTKVHEYGTDNNTSVNASQWYLVDPDVATANVVITRKYSNNTQGVVACASNYTGVVSASPIYDYGDDSYWVSPSQVSVNTSVSSVVVDVLALPDNDSGAYPAVNYTNQTSIYINANPHTYGDTRGCFSEKAGTGDYELVGWTFRNEVYINAAMTVDYIVNVTVTDTVNTLSVANPDVTVLAVKNVAISDSVNSLTIANPDVTITGGAVAEDTANSLSVTNPSVTVVEGVGAVIEDTANSLTITNPDVSIALGSTITDTANELALTNPDVTATGDANIDDSVTGLVLYNTDVVVSVQQNWGASSSNQTNWANVSDNSTTWNDSSNIETNWSDV